MSIQQHGRRWESLYPDTSDSVQYYIGSYTSSTLCVGFGFMLMQHRRRREPLYFGTSESVQCYLQQENLFP